ncbi:UvrD-helicase domain-containing protein [Halorubrum ruber]|uniref:DNA 3'-5' helicase n=1 Tax=Halorubrum ruber TaxID=2982524 RepID=A0A8T8LJX3_9EURY|nr:UvrD-helicase domain-containing protein [Halorubrum ruber]QUO47188.1 ATP-dependent helicase [Halorubrum ruber]
MPGEPTDYDAATDYEDAAPPEAVRSGLPEELKDAQIKGGETYPVTDSIRLNGPPGVGKTTQVCLRVSTLITEYDIDPSDVTIVTYRRSLADEIGDRLKSWGVIDDDADLSMWTTAHACANRVTGLLSRDKGSANDYQQNSGRGLGPAVTTYEQSYFCSDVLNIRYWSGQPWESTRGQLLFDVFEYAANNLLDPRDEGDLREIPAYDDLREEWPGVDVATVYEQWQQFKGHQDLVEFHELLEAAVDGPLPPTKVVVVDEYHDAYPLLAQVAERWVAAANTAIVAGDPLQVVNAYAGADPRFFTDRMDHLPEVLLDKSWRVAEEHWQVATRMLQREFEAPPIDRHGRGEIHEYQSPEFTHAQNAGWTVPGANQPASPVALADEYVAGNDNRDMLLLARTQKQAQGVSAALDKGGVVHETQDADDVGGWTQRRVDALNAVLKLQTVPGSYGQDTNQYGLMKYDGDAADFRLDAEEAAVILEHAHGRTLEHTSDELDSFVESLRSDSENSDNGQTLSADDLDKVVKPAFWRKYTDGPATVRRLTKAGEFEDEDLKALQKAAVRYDDPVPGDVLKKVRVLTIHASKGSEATDVVIYDGITSTIGTEMERSRSTRENEARTWYVGLTRASERLHIMREGFSWVQPHLPRDIAPVAAVAAERAVEDESARSEGGEA